LTLEALAARTKPVMRNASRGVGAAANQQPANERIGSRRRFPL